MSKCTSVVKVKTGYDGSDLVKVTIDDEITAYMFTDYTACLEFLNQEVIVTFDKDIIEGKIEQVIRTFTVPVKATVLAREDNIKLFCNEIDNNSNICFCDITEGTVFPGAVMYVTKTEYKMSERASWIAFYVRDKIGKVSVLRLFDYDRAEINYSGMYIKASIRKSIGGFVTSEVRNVDYDYPTNPEIAIARSFIETYFIGDDTINEIINRTKLLEYMSKYIDTEKGYLLVRTAVQLDILQGLRNDFNDINFTAVAYAILLNNGYITKDQEKGFSKGFMSSVFVLQAKLPKDISEIVIKIIDPGQDDNTASPERRVYDSVLRLAETVILVKKGVF